MMQIDSNPATVTVPTPSESAPTKPSRKPRTRTKTATRPSPLPSPRVVPPTLNKSKQLEIRLSRIDLGDRRYENAYGVNVLARSIRETGLFTPILVDEAMNLIDGHRRLMAARELGLKKVPVCVVELDVPIFAFIATHKGQRSLSPGEKYSISQALMELAKDPEWRKGLLGGRMEAAAKKGRLDELIASHVGLSRESLRKIRLIQTWAREDHDRFGDIVAALDRDGKIDRHYREMQRRIARGNAAAARAIIVAPEWTTPTEGETDLLQRVRDANLSARGDAGCLLLVSTPIPLLATASTVVDAAGFHWTETVLGDPDQAWMVGVLGKTSEIDPNLIALLKEESTRGIVGLNSALEVALGTTPLIVNL